MIQIRALVEADHEWVAATLTQAWNSASIVTRGQVYDVTMLPGFIAIQDATRIGLLTYHIAGGDCEIITLNSMQQGQGIGTQLVQAVKHYAQQQQCRRLWLITTNDNVTAQEFFQRRGFTFKAIYANAVEISRMLKPEIPLVNAHGVPIKDELEYEVTL